MNFLSSELRPGLCVHTDHQHHLSSNLPQAQAAQKMIPLFSSSLEEGQNATTRERKIIHRSQFENYIFMHFLPSGVPANQRLFISCQWPVEGVLKVKRGIKLCRKIMLFSTKTLISEEGPQPEIVTTGTRRSTTSQREVPQIHTPRWSIVHHTQKQQYVCLTRRIPCLVKDHIAPPFLIHPTLTPSCLPTMLTLALWVCVILVFLLLPHLD